MRGSTVLSGATLFRFGPDSSWISLTDSTGIGIFTGSLNYDKLDLDRAFLIPATPLILDCVTFYSESIG